MITEFTPEQKKSIAFYQQKWRAISLSTERIDRQRVVSVLENVYNLYPEWETMPEVIFFDSPYAAFSAHLIIGKANFNGLSDDEIYNKVASLKTLGNEGYLKNDLWLDLDSDLSFSRENPQISDELWNVLWESLIDKIGSSIYEQLWEVLWDWLREKLYKDLKDTIKAYWSFYDNFIDRDSEWATYPGLFDFCINELGWEHDSEQWQVYQDVCSECGWWFLPTVRRYIICDRPTKLLLDDTGKLHADAELAIEFADGFGLYAQHGEISSVCFPKT